MKARIITAAAAVLMLGSSAAAIAQPAPIPPPESEYGPPPPMPGPNGWVLEPGHWRWTGYRYVWVRRHWVQPRAGYAHFVPGHWNGMRWVPPHWAQ